MSPERDDLERALAALASDATAPTLGARSVIARGRHRMRVRRLTAAGVALALIAGVAIVGTVANGHHAARIVAPASTTSTSTTVPEGHGPSQQIAVASATEAWKCLNPLQYTDNGGRSWRTITLPDTVPPGALDCAAAAGGNLWAVWADPATNHTFTLRVQNADAADARVFFFPLPATDTVFTPTFADAERGWVQVESHDSRATLLRTVDGGQSWTSISTNGRVEAPVFADDDHGWSVHRGALLASVDGGSRWRPVELPNPTDGAHRSPSLFRVVARGRSVVVWGGYLIAGSRYQTFFDVSRDLGTTWTQRAGPPGFELAGAGADQNTFDATDELHWAIVSGNALRVTDDGGRTWQTRPDLPESSGEVSRIVYAGPDTIWAGTQSGAILRTTDGGQTWIDVTDGATPTTTSTTTPAATESHAAEPLAFVSATEGWICGNRLSYSTANFDQFQAGTKSIGLPRAPHPSPGNHQPTLCTAAPGGNAWVVRASSDPDQPQVVRIHARSTGDDASVFPFARIPDGTVTGIDFVDADTGWAVVSNASAPDLYGTHDGGATWTLLARNAPIGGSINFADPSHGWAEGYTLPTLAVTSDGGRTWSPVTVPTPPGATQYAGVAPVLVAGDTVVTYGAWDTDSGVQLRAFVDVSTDRGRTWSLRSGPEGVPALPGTFPGVFAASDTDHWALASANRLSVTDDGGRSWTMRAQFAGTKTIQYVARPSTTSIFVSGTSDLANHATVVLGTTDAGNNWSTVDFWAPPGAPGDAAPFPGGLVGCPTEPLTAPPAGDPPPDLVRAATDYVRAVRHWTAATAVHVYRVGENPAGSFGGLFEYQVGSCGSAVANQSWVVELTGPPLDPALAQSRAQLALAHYADGWHVFGFSH